MSRIRLLFGTISRDWRANRENPKGRIILVWFRVLRPVSSLRNQRRFGYFLGLPAALCFTYTFCVEWILGVELPLSVSLGAGAKLFHGQGLVINPGAVIGEDCTLRHTTTIGNKVLPDGSFSGCPILGNRVEVGAHAVIIGPVNIGNDAVIGAAAVVTRDVPSAAVVAGNPARVIAMRTADCCTERRRATDLKCAVHSE